MAPPVPDLARAAARTGGTPITRFAPSPTGYLHLGHVVNAIYVWGLARALGGRVLLRIEDHDRIRSQAQFERSILEDLAWLGFEPDEGAAPVQRQSNTSTRYEQALSRLREAHHVYACACSRRTIGGERYGGRCRNAGIAEGAGRGLRVELKDSVERFDDLLLGRQEQRPADQCGDLLLKDRDGNWTYQFAVTVDDAIDGVNLVIRGEDLVSSTGRQLALGQMLGRTEPPAYLHHPLVLKTGGHKLSKAARDSGVRELRQAGIHPDQVIAHAAAAVGLLDTPTSITADDVAGLFLQRHDSA